MLSVELKHLANVLDAVGVLANVSSQAKEWGARIEKAVWDTTVRDVGCRSCHEGAHLL